MASNPHSKVKVIQKTMDVSEPQKLQFFFQGLRLAFFSKDHNLVLIIEIPWRLYLAILFQGTSE